MNRKALEMPFSVILTLLILLITFILILILYASWHSQGISFIDKFFRMFR